MISIVLFYSFLIFLGREVFLPWLERVLITFQITTPVERAKIAISHRGFNGESNPVRKKEKKR